MKKERLLILFLGLFVIVAFKDRRPVEALKTATYGICECEKSSPGTPQFELTVNEDHTFHYVSTTNPKKKVDVTGNWEWNKKTIVLKNYAAGVAIHDKWKMESKYPCITSRKGMEFSRLCEVKKCD